MIVWLNGPFGVGKTQTADELHVRLPGSFVADVEELGEALRRLTPTGLHSEDFQDHPLWRPFVLETLSELAKRFPGPILVPMTLTNPKYHREIVGGLRAVGVAVEHFSLVAPPEVVLRRLRSRGSRQQAWGTQRVADCLEALNAPQFARQVNTHGLSIPEVAEAVAQEAGLSLTPRRGALQATWARVGMSIRR